MQTLVKYRYTDASNWKFFGSIVVNGVVSAKDVNRYLFDTDYFVPHEVGMRHLLNMPMNEDDHYLHKFDSFEPTTERACHCTKFEFIKNFREASKKGWFFSFSDEPMNYAFA